MNEKVGIQDVARLLAAKHGLKDAEADAFAREFFALIVEALERDRYVKIKGLGVFKLIAVDSRESIHVNTGERIEISGHTKISFTPDAALKETINKPFSHFETVVLNEGVTFDDIPMESDEAEFVPTEAPKSEAQAEPAAPTEKITAPEETPVVPEEALATQEEATVASKETPLPLVEPEIPAAEPMKTVETVVEKKSSSARFWAIAAVILLLLLCGGAYLYFGRQKPAQVSPVASAQKATEAVATSVAVADTARQDTVKPSTSVAVPATTKAQKPQTTVASTTPATKKATPTPFVPDSTGYVITGTETTHTISEGETLTRVALRYYGTKALWPYIVQHNRDVIKNPNHVPYGTTVRIPKLRKKTASE